MLFNVRVTELFLVYQYTYIVCLSREPVHSNPMCDVEMLPMMPLYPEQTKFDDLVLGRESAGMSY